MESKPPRILPPVYFFLALLAMVALHYLVPVARILRPPYTYGGIVLILAGLAISNWAAASFAKADTPVVPFKRSTVLVTHGLYRFTRNPMYLGLVVTLVGVAVLLGTLSPWLPIPVFAWIMHTRFILGEERFLEELFGEQYLAYKRRVRRWL